MKYANGGEYKKVSEFSTMIEDVYPKNYYPPTTLTTGPSIIVRVRSRKMRNVISVQLCAVMDIDKLPDDKSLWGESWIDRMVRVGAVRKNR